MMANRYEMPACPSSPGDAVIRMRGVVKTFRVEAGETTVLRDINMDILQGQFVSVVGRSGSGKSTLVNMITGIDKPTSGTVEIGGIPVLEMHESEMAVWRGKNLGIVFQFYQLLPMLTLIENVMLPMDFCNVYPPASREKRAMDLLGRVGIENLAFMLPGEVAGGQQQCAAVARALANDPPILIADEPTGNLDTNTAEQVMGIFQDLAAGGKTILLVTHDRGLSMRTRRRLLISDGELVNEALFTFLPDAPHSQLLELSKQAIALKLPPGSPVPDDTGMSGSVYLVASGEIKSRVTEVHRRFSAGTFLSIQQDLEGLHAGEQGAELLALPQEMALPLVPGVVEINSGDSNLPEKIKSSKRHTPRRS